MKDALAEKEAGPTSVTLDPPPESERLLKISSPQEILLENLGSPLGESCQRKLTERGLTKSLPRDRHGEEQKVDQWRWVQHHAAGSSTMLSTVGSSLERRRK